MKASLSRTLTRFRPCSKAWFDEPTSSDRNTQYPCRSLRDGAGRLADSEKKCLRQSNLNGFGIQIVQCAKSLVEVPGWRGLRHAGQFQHHAQAAMGTVNDMTTHFQGKLHVF